MVRSRKEIVQNLSVFINSIRLNYIQYIFISRGAVYSYALGILKREFNKYFKTILKLFNTKLLGKGGRESLNKDLVFK